MISLRPATLLVALVILASFPLASSGPSRVSLWFSYYSSPQQTPPVPQSLSFINLSYVRPYVPTFLSNVTALDFWQAWNVSTPSFVPGLYFPVFPRAKTVYVVDMRGYYPSQEGVLLAAVSAQGIENRYDANIYIEYQGVALSVYNLSSYAHLVFYNGSDPLKFIISLARPHIKGIVVYDPSVPDTKNLATTIAGLGNLVMSSPSLLPTLEGMGLKVVVNLNKLVQEYHWNNSEEGRVAMYQWAYEYLWPYCDHLIIGVENPGAAVSRPPETAYVATRDYVVALKLICLYLSANESGQPQEYALYSKFLSTAPHPIPVMGWINGQELPTVSLLSKYGDWVAVMVNIGSPLYIQDLTVFSSIMVKPETYIPKISKEAIMETLNPGVYLSLYVSEGDNMQYDVDYLYEFLKDLNGLPVGFTINTNIVNVAPVIWNYYVSALEGNTTLVGPLSGSGYWHPRDATAYDVELYLNYTRNLLNITGIRTNEVDGWDDNYTSLYYDKLGSMELGLFRGYGGLHNLNTFYYYGAPIPIDQNNFGYGWNGQGQPAPNVWDITANLVGSAQTLEDQVSQVLTGLPPIGDYGLLYESNPLGHTWFGTVFLLGYEITPQTRHEISYLSNSSDGVFLLNTDEYMAALNPSYMLNLAKEEVKDFGDPSAAAEMLSLAEKAYGEGQYKSSLIYSRKAIVDAMAWAYEVKLVRAGEGIQVFVYSPYGFNVTGLPVYLYARHSEGQLLVLRATTNGSGVANFAGNFTEDRVVAYVYGVSSGANDVLSTSPLIPLAPLGSAVIFMIFAFVITIFFGCRTLKHSEAKLKSPERAEAKEEIGYNGAYDALLRHYSLTWGPARLEHDISDLMKKGMSREEAVMYLYRRTFGDH